MKKIKYGVVILLAVAIFSLARELPIYADTNVEAVGDGDESALVGGSESEGDGEKLGETEGAGEGEEEGEGKEEVAWGAKAGEANESGADENEADVALRNVRVIMPATTYMVKFLEVGESFTVTDARADGYEVNSGMPMMPMSAIIIGDADVLRGELRVAPAGVTVAQGEEGVWTVTANAVGNYTVFLTYGNYPTTAIMINTVEFTNTDDPTLNTVMDNFKTAMKAIEEAINSGDQEAMQNAWQNYMEAMQADAKIFYGWNEYNQMLALMRVMSMLISGEDLVVEQYVYEYTDEDIEWIYENDSEYATVLDELQGMLAEAGYTENASIYDFDLVVYNMNDEPDEDGEREPVAWLNELPEERIIVIEAESPAEGYERQYYVVRAHFEGYEMDEDGEYVYDENGDWIPIYSYTVIDHVDYDASEGLLGVWSDKFSTFAISYKDTLIPDAPNTGAFTNEKSSASTSSAVVMLMVAMVATAGAIKFAKRK